MARRRIRRLMPPVPPHELYKRAAELERRAIEVAEQRRSLRAYRLGHSIARGVQHIADEQTKAAA